MTLKDKVHGFRLHLFRRARGVGAHDLRRLALALSAERDLWGCRPTPSSS